MGIVLVESQINDPTPTTTEIITEITGEGDDTYNGHILLMTSGGSKHECSVILDYISATGTFKMQPGLQNAPADDDHIAIIMGEPRRPKWTAHAGLTWRKVSGDDQLNIVVWPEWNGRRWNSLSSSATVSVKVVEQGTETEKFTVNGVDADKDMDGVFHLTQTNPGFSDLTGYYALITITDGDLTFDGMEVDAGIETQHKVHELHQAGVVAITQVNDASATTTAFVTDLTEATDDHFNHTCGVLFLTGALAGQIRRIKDYNGTTKQITVRTMTDAPADNDWFAVIPWPAGVESNSQGRVARASFVWDTTAGDDELQVALYGELDGVKQSLGATITWSVTIYEYGTALAFMSLSGDQTEKTAQDFIEKTQALPNFSVDHQYYAVLQIVDGSDTYNGIAPLSALA